MIEKGDVKTKHNLQD